MVRIAGASLYLFLRFPHTDVQEAIDNCPCHILARCATQLSEKYLSCMGFPGSVIGFSESGTRFQLMHPIYSTTSLFLVKQYADSDEPEQLQKLPHMCKQWESSLPRTADWKDQPLNVTTLAPPTSITLLSIDPDFMNHKLWKSWTNNPAGGKMSRLLKKIPSRISHWYQLHRE